MMHAANHRPTDNLALAGRLNLSRCRCVVIQRLMRSRTVIVLEELAEDSREMRLVQHDDMVKTLAPNRPDQSLNVRILPGE